MVEAEVTCWEAIIGSREEVDVAVMMMLVVVAMMVVVVVVALVMMKMMMMAAKPLSKGSFRLFPTLPMMRLEKRTS